MGNKLNVPIPTYETAITHFMTKEINELKSKFQRLSNGQDSIGQSVFLSQACSNYARKYYLPKLFQVIDTKKDGVIDFQEYICAVVFFRIGTFEDKVKILLFMYEPAKTGAITRDKLKELIIDSMVDLRNDKESIYPLSTIDSWIQDQKILADALVDMVLNQYASQDNKLEFQELVLYLKSEGSIQNLLTFSSDLLECKL